MENKIKTTGEAETKEEEGNFTYIYIYTYVYIYIVLSLQLCPTLVAPWTVTHQAPVHEIFQARILEWVALSFFRDLPDPGIESTSLMSHALAGGSFYH